MLWCNNSVVKLRLFLIYLKYNCFYFICPENIVTNDKIIKYINIDKPAKK